MKIACIGAGNVGRSWAIKFAEAGHEVVLWDHDSQALDQAISAIRLSVEDMVIAGSSINAEHLFARLHISDSMASAVTNVDYVQESISENVESKKQVFVKLDQYAAEYTILASSTSAIQASDFLSDVEGRHRCLIVHPVNPPHLIPLVELCGSPWTAPEVIERARAIMLELGQAPITVNKEVEGFILNRLQWALLGEAMHLVGEGYCSAEDIDLVLTKGLAMRWAFLGPFEVGHLNSSEGLQGYFDGLGDSIKSVQASLNTGYMADDKTIDSVHNRLEQRFSVENIKQHQVWRDRQIIQLKQFLDSSES